MPGFVTLFTIVYLLLFNTTCALDLVRCGAPLGMESGDIPDSAISASSVHDSGSVGPQHGRLRHDKNGGAWCPRSMVSQEGGEYLEVRLPGLTVVSGSRTQGRFGNGQGQEYAEEFMLDYWRPGLNKWRRWKDRSGKQLLPGNTNTYTVVEQKVEPLIVASKVRFIPHSDHVRTVCMRVEVLGCPWREGLIGYSMPQGEKRPGEVDLTDHSYDGTEEGGWLSGGLGQLVDGHHGQDNFRLDVFGLGKGYEWVGWRNDSQMMMGKPVEITFEFDRLRNFSAMYLHTNNLISQGVQVFSHAKVYMSVGGRVFNGQPVYYTYMADVVMEQARNVTIKLHHRVGRFVKLQLYFASRWILVSEVSFDSVVVPGNLTEEEVENSFISVIDQGRDDPLQRDEVHTTPSKDERKKSGMSSSVGKEPESKSIADILIGCLVTFLIVVIVVLVGGIGYMVRSRRQRASGPLSGLPGAFPPEKTELQMRVNVNSNGHVYGQVSSDEPEKNILYHEPINNHINRYQFQTSNILQSPGYTDVVQEYAIPHVNSVSVCQPTFISKPPPPTPVRSIPPPSLQTLFPKPPPVPPPPEQYYAATEICKAPPIPVSPPPSIPPSIGSQGASSSSSYGVGVNSSSHQIDPGDRESPIPPVQDVSWGELQIIRKLGTGQFGDIHLCKLQRLPDHCNSLVAVKTLRSDASDILREEFESDLDHFSSLRNRNLSQLLGVCLNEEPYSTIWEYTDYGDLNQFLQDHVAESANFNANTLSYGCLIYMATQVASGMKYLETINVTHCDLATRNCLVGNDYSIKVSDLGLGRHLYPIDYFDMGGKESFPIRWMAWESIVMRTFSIKSDVWAFAVTLWEILTFAREQPFEELTNEKILENATHYCQKDKKEEILQKPINCPKEIFDLMIECWQRNASVRPSFREIHLFLQRKNLGYKPLPKKMK